MTGRSTDADLCIVGGGDAGFIAALAGTALGLRVVLADANATEPCWRNWDVALAVLRRVARDTGGASRDHDAARQRFQAALRDALQAAAPDRRFARLAAMNVRVLRGHARFRDARTIEIGEEFVRARRMIIATGVGDRGPEGSERVTVERLADRAGWPTAATLWGSEARDVALAQGLRRLGSAVTLRAPGGLLPGTDGELTAVIRRALIADGVTIDETSQDVSDTAPRPAEGDELGFGPAGIALRDGRPLISPALRTTNPRVYAVGAVAGAMSTQAIQAQVAVALKAAFFRLPVRYDPTRVPFCLDTDPALATVGLSEAEAAAHGPVSVWRWPFAETTAGAANPGQPGFVKVVTDGRGRIVGAGVVHQHAAEQIGFWSLAIQSRRSLADLADVHLPASAFADASRRIALQHAARRMRSPWLKRALALLGWLG